MPYPDKINALVDIAGTSTLAAVNHAARHNDVNDALDELKVVLTVPAANTLALAPGGTERMRINAAGNVGIGTTSPSTALHVKAAWVANEGQIIADVTSGGRYSGVTVQNDGTIKGVMVWDNTDSRLCLSLPGTSGLISLGPNSTNLGLVYDGTNNRMQFYSQDGTERLRVDSAGLITGTGTSLGAWTAYTPTLTAVTTNPTLGTGSTTAGAYCQIGKIVHFRVNITFGTSGTAAGSGAYVISLPLTASSNNTAPTSIGIGTIGDSSAGARYNCNVVYASTTSVQLQVTTAAVGTVTVSTEASPMAWAASDYIRISGTYEIA